MLHPRWLPIALLVATQAWAGTGQATGGAPDRLAEAVILTAQAGTAPEDIAIQDWQLRVRKPDAGVALYERLGWAYVAKARRTLDAGYYKLAEKTADAMDARFGVSQESRLLRGHVLHNLHRFAAAEKLARELVAERGAPTDYALLSDALMEEGRLDESVAALQKMVDLRPGMESYSRIAHLRWLKGDLAGATQAMEDAVHAGSPRDAESYAWVLSRLSLYYLQAAQAPRALLVAQSAAKYAPDFPPALLASGRALLALGRNEPALAVLTRAAELNPLPEYQWWLADTQRLLGHEEDARRTEALIVARGAVADPRTYSLYLATRGVEVPVALRLAQEEMTNRADVFSHDALAWASEGAGERAVADKEITLALADHTLDARLYLHAGEIARSESRVADARIYFEKAQTLATTLTPSEKTLLGARLKEASALTAEAPKNFPVSN